MHEDDYERQTNPSHHLRVDHPVALLRSHAFHKMRSPCPGAVESFLQKRTIYVYMYHMIKNCNTIYIHTIYK
jgi:hypothetical protein